MSKPELRGSGKTLLFMFCADVPDAEPQVTEMDLEMNLQNHINSKARDSSN